MAQSEGPADGTAGRVLLDKNERLSDCSIWPMLEQVYSTGPGRALWEAIPFFPTSNAFAAECYADLIVSFLRDYCPQLDRAEPVYIIELGCGSGCFSFYLLKELFRKLNCFSDLSEVNVRYVMTDFTPAAIGDCRLDESFAQFRERGSLSFALFKPEEQFELVTYGGTTLASDTIKNPVLVIANYFFDSLRQDAFRIRNGRLQEVLHTFFRRFDKKAGGFEQLEKLESYRDIEEDYYDDEVLDGILRFYQQRFKNATIIFPLGAFRVLDNLRRLSNRNFVLLSTDRGFTRESYVAGLWQQPFQCERSYFSYPVNYYAIRKYFEHYGGVSFASSGDSLCVHTQLSCMLAEPGFKLEQTSYCFTEGIARRNPINFLFDCQDFLTGLDIASPQECVAAYIALVRLCNCDPIAFVHCAEKIQKHLDGIPRHVASDLSAMLNMVEENFFHITQWHDSLYWIGRLRFALQEYDGAISALSRSISEYGENTNSLFYLAACHEMKGDFESALAGYEQSLELSPASEATAAAILRIKEKQL